MSSISDNSGSNKFPKRNASDIPRAPALEHTEASQEASAPPLPPHAMDANVSAAVAAASPPIPEIISQDAASSALASASSSATIVPRIPLLPELIATSPFSEGLRLLTHYYPSLLEPSQNPPADAYVLTALRQEIRVFFNGNPSAIPSILLHLLSLPDIPHVLIEALHVARGREIAASVGEQLLLPERDPAKPKITVGFIGDGFGDGVVFDFLLPVLQHLDRNQFEIFCFETQARRDTVSFQRFLAPLVEQNLIALEDLTGRGAREAALAIRTHDVDILVDINGHTGKPALEVMAYRPARKQATWLGYPSRTGLPTIDFRVTSQLVDEASDVAPEKMICMPGPFLCHSNPYIRYSYYPKVLPTPALSRNGYLTFACTNNPNKISAPFLRQIRLLLEAFPTSKMIFKYIHFNEWLLRFLCTQAGIDLNRVRIIVGHEDYFKHLAEYDQFDICLDPSPYSGTTTTCEACIMGVPTVTLPRASTHIAQVTAMIMTMLNVPRENLHPDELARRIEVSDVIAIDEADMIEKVRRLGTVERLTEYREKLRSTFLTSKMADKRGFTKIFGETLAKAAGFPLKK